MLKLKNDSNPSIPVNDMRDGQVAVIRAHDSESHVGKVVQRYKNTLIAIGEESGYCWPTLFETPAPHLKDFKVEILPKGTEFVLA